MALRVYLVGRVMIETADEVIEASALPGRQGRLAFVYLAERPRRVDRHELADVLWDELPDQWEPALTAIMSKLRKLLTAADPGCALEGRDGAYELRFSPGSWLDLQTAVNSLDRAEGAMRRGDARTAWTAASVASSIVRRPFLAGESGHWVERVRRDLHEYEIRAFDVIARAWLTLGEPTAALTAARHLVDLAPYRESAHARVMECHLAAGNRAEAVRTYTDLRAMLAETMGLAPNEATERLYLDALG